jgi:hypothetical protein
MHRHECNTHNFLFNLENQTKDFSYTIIPAKKNKCWKNFKIYEKNCYLIILSIHILKLEISGCDMFATLDSSQQTPTQENHSFSLRNTLREQPSDARTGKVKRSRGIRTMGKKVLHPSRRSVVVRKRVGSASGTREILRRRARGGAGIMEKNCVRNVCTGRCVCSISIR